MEYLRWAIMHRSPPAGEGKARKRQVKFVGEIKVFSRHSTKISFNFSLILEEQSS